MARLLIVHHTPSPTLQETYVHGNNDTTGAVEGVTSIAKGLGWRQIREPVTVGAALTDDDREACWELGAATAAGPKMG